MWYMSINYVDNSPVVPVGSYDGTGNYHDNPSYNRWCKVVF